MEKKVRNNHVRLDLISYVDATKEQRERGKWFSRTYEEEVGYHYNNGFGDLGW